MLYRYIKLYPNGYIYIPVGIIILNIDQTEVVHPDQVTLSKLILWKKIQQTLTFIIPLWKSCTLYHQYVVHSELTALQQLVLRLPLDDVLFLYATWSTRDKILFHGE